MKPSLSRSPVLTLLAGLLALLSACASPNLPKTVALEPTEQRQALARLMTMSRQPQPSSVETGYQLSWQILGQSGRLEVQLQMDAPDLLRFTALDPLGRTLYLAVADGRKFALIDNRAASVQRGLVNGRVWRELVPEPLKVQDVVALLAGRLERVPAFGVRAEQNPEQNGYWFSWDHPGLSHRVLVDKKTGLMARHLLLENEGGKTGILLDLRYIDYDQDRGSGYFWPRTTEVQGSLVKGSLRLARSGPLSFDPLPLSTFHPDIPPHFKVQELY